MAKKSKQPKPAAGAAQTAPAGVMIDPALVIPPERTDTIAVLDVVVTDRNARAGIGIETLRASLEREGLQQPIGVARTADGLYELIFGHRRLAAAQALGWEKIEARIWPCWEGAGRGANIQRLRIVENAERRDLNPIEEAIAVRDLLAELEPHLPSHEAAIARAAETIGRSETWVRDRDFLGRLDRAVQDLVIEGLLPAGHAREIAKLADGADQLQIAHMAQREDDGSGGRSIEDVRRWVGERLRTLRGVPWRLEVPFGDRPACSECPNNTANAARLFEHDRPPDTGMCLDGGCFAAKRREAEKQVRGAVKAAVKRAGKDAAFTATARQVEALPATPAFVKPEVVSRQARKELAIPAPTTTTPGPGKAAKAPPLTAEQEARRKYEAAHREWECKLWPALEAHYRERPVAAALLLLASASKLWGEGGGSWGIGSDAKRAAVRARQPWKNLMRAIAADLEPGFHVGLGDAGAEFENLLVGVDPAACLEQACQDADDEVVQELLKARGIDVGPEPKIEDFLPAPEAAPAKAPGKKKPTKRAKKGGKAS